MSAVMDIKRGGKNVNNNSELFLVLRFVQGEGLCHAVTRISHSRWIAGNVADNSSPNEGKGRWECSLSGQGEPSHHVTV